MCGIFGFSYIDKKKLINYSDVKKDIGLFTKLNKIRGSDTFGVSISSDKENFIYKVNTDPILAIQRKDYKLFLQQSLENLSKKDQNKICIIGQTRLVTNGTKFLYSNNQPIITKYITGVHNGIIINLKDEEQSKTPNLEGYGVKSDSLEFYENLSQIKEKKEKFFENYLNYLKNIVGNYSIAFKLLDSSKIIISSNCGSLYYFFDRDLKKFIFSSEKNFLIKFIKKSKLFEKNSSNFEGKIIKVINQSIIFDEKEYFIEQLNHNTSEFSKINLNLNKNEYTIFDNFSESQENLKNLKKCNKCILPETYPFINFDNNGVCNFCNSYEKQEYKGDEKLLEILNKYRSKDHKPDCLVGLSGGRDSSYGLHLLKTKYNMNPVAYTYDWGLTTDISRINQSRICGKLGIEHVIRSANISKKRAYIRKNIMAWLQNPHLGMVPIVQAGDKGFIDYGRILSKEYKIDCVVHFIGHQLEQREFFLGFAGINQKLKNNQRMHSYDTLNKIKMFFFYSYQFLVNPSYINSALFDNFNGFLASFVRKENFLHFFNYIKWDEEEIKKVLKHEYDWESDISYGKNQWRMGDGQTAFNNYIYYTVAGFSEYDNFRSNQIREGLITRDQGIKLAQEDNEFKYDTLKNFSEIVGFNLEDVLSRIQCIPKLY